MQKFNLWEKDIPLYDESIKNEENAKSFTIEAYLVDEDDDKKRSAMVILPGGGYRICSDEGEKFANWLNFLGINAFVVRYRVAPYRHPAPIIDAKRAIRYVRYNAEKFNVDVNKVGVIGFSAGGHLAGCVCEFFNKFEEGAQDEIDKMSAKPDLGVLCYPVVSLCEDFAHQGSTNNLLGESLELRKALSVEKNVREDMPEMFIWHTLEDTIVSAVNSLELSKALKEKNVKHSLHIFNNGEHGSVLAENIEGTKQWSECLKQVLKDKGFLDR